MNRRRMTAHRAAPPRPSELQGFNFNATPAAGSFKLVFDGQTTGAIAWNADSAAITAALEALANIGSGNVVATRGGNDVSIDFSVGSLAGEDVPQISSTDSTLTAAIAAPTLTVTRTGRDTTYNALTFPDADAAAGSYFTDGTAGTKAEQYDAAMVAANRGTYSYGGNTYNFDEQPVVAGWTVLDFGLNTAGYIYIERNTNGSTTQIPVSNIDLESSNFDGLTHSFRVTLPAGVNAGKFYLAEDGVQEGPEFAYNATPATVQAGLAGNDKNYGVQSNATYQCTAVIEGAEGDWTVHSSPTDPLKRVVAINHFTNQQGG